MLRRCRLLSLLTLTVFITSHAATAATITYPDFLVDPPVTEWNATSGIAAGDTVILQNAATYTSSVSPIVNSGSLQFDVAQGSNSQNSPYLFSLNLSGTGAVQATSGFTYLTGTNSYTGGTLISGATLMATTSALTGTINNQGELIFQQDMNGTFSGTVIGGGAWKRIGTGTVTLTGSMAPASQITNYAFGGRLIGNTRNLQGPIENNGGSLEFNQTFSGTFNGNFGTFDTGSVYKTGAGDLTLTGNNRLQSAGQSDLFIEAGRVVGAAQSLDFNGTITISAGAEMRINEPVGGFVYQMATEIVGNGDVYKTGAGTVDMAQVLNDYGGITTVAQGKLLYSAGQMPQSAVTGSYGEIRLTGSGTGNSAGIEITTSGGIVEYPGVISGAGSVTVTGNGTLELTGANSYAGGTYVTMGQVRGSVASMPGPFTLDNGGVGIARVEFVQNTTATISSAISGAGEIVKSGSGRLTISSGTSNLAGTIDVSNGTLVVNRSMPNIARTRVLNGATLAGSGTVGSAQEFFTGIEVVEGALKPGNSAGILTTNNLNMFGGQTSIEWELFANTASAGARGTSYDGINLTGGDLTIQSGATLNLVFNGAGSSVNWWDSLWDSNQTWVLIDGATAFTGGSGDAFSIYTTSLDSAGGSLSALRPGASFLASHDSGNGDLVISYTAAALVPEPSTYAMALAGLGCGGYSMWRRRKRASTVPDKTLVMLSPRNPKATHSRRGLVLA